jgi:endonuclease/exonuclease/phosphatase family metal-dependent hydrolase
VAVELRVATFNIQHGLTAGGEVDIDLLARVCRRLDVDALGLQEVDRNLERTAHADTTALVAEECEMMAAFGPAIAARGGEYGNALLVRGEIDDVEVLDLPRPSGREARAALIATATVRGLTLTAAVSHLSVPVEDSGPQLQVLVDALSGRPSPQVLLGDLNLPPEALEPLVAAGYAVAGGGPTWPARTPRRRIDHVAALGLDVVGVETPETPSSDHRPLIARLSLPGS